MLPGCNEHRTVGYDSEASLDGVGEQEASWCVDLFVLLLNVLCNLLQNLKGKNRTQAWIYFTWKYKLPK